MQWTAKKLSCTQEPSFCLAALMLSSILPHTRSCKASREGGAFSGFGLPPSLGYIVQSNQLIALSRVLSVIFFASSVLENSRAFKLKKERGIHALNEKARQWKL